MSIEIIILLIKAYQEAFLISLVIVFGSIVHATNAIKISREKGNIKKIGIKDIIILLIISSFAWFLFALWPLAFWLNIYFTMAFAWVWAYLWIEWLNAISKLALWAIVDYLNSKKWIQIKMNEEYENKW